MPRYRVEVVTETEYLSRIFDDAEHAEQDAYAFAETQALYYKGTPGLSINVEPIGS